MMNTWRQVGYSTGILQNNLPGPRFFKSFSLAASDALVDEAGYSPPTPWRNEVSFLGSNDTYNTSDSSTKVEAYL